MTKLALCHAQAHGGAAVLKAAQSLGGGQKAPALQLLAKHDVQPGSGAAAAVPAAPASPGKRDAAAACCVMAAAVSCVVVETSFCCAGGYMQKWDFLHVVLQAKSHLQQRSQIHRRTTHGDRPLPSRTPRCAQHCSAWHCVQHVVDVQHTLCSGASSVAHNEAISQQKAHSDGTLCSCWRRRRRNPWRRCCSAAPRRRCGCGA